jgi:excisionase family DNA binding protein
MTEQEKDITKEKGLSVKQMIVILAVLALLAALVWGYNLYRLKNVTFDGLTRYTEEEFKQKLEQNFLTSLTPFFCLTDTFMQKEIELPLWQKMNLTLDEASEYTGIGKTKLRELSDKEDCPFVLWNGAKRLFKRKKLEEYLEETNCL